MTNAPDPQPDPTADSDSKSNPREQDLVGRTEPFASKGDDR